MGWGGGGEDVEREVVYLVVLVGGQRLGVEAEVGLGGGGGGGGGGRLFDVRRTAGLAVAVDRRRRTQRHRIGLLDQVAQLVEVGRRGEERRRRRPRRRGGRPRRIRRRQQAAAVVVVVVVTVAAAAAAAAVAVVVVVVVVVVVGQRVLVGGQGVRQDVRVGRVAVRRQRTVGHAARVRSVAQQQLQRVVHHVARAGRPFGDVGLVQQAQRLPCCCFFQRRKKKTNNNQPSIVALLHSQAPEARPSFFFSIRSTVAIRTKPAANNKPINQETIVGFLFVVADFASRFQRKHYRSFNVMLGRSMLATEDGSRIENSKKNHDESFFFKSAVSARRLPCCSSPSVAKTNKNVLHQFSTNPFRCKSSHSSIILSSLLVCLCEPIFFLCRNPIRAANDSHDTSWS